MLLMEIIYQYNVSESVVLSIQLKWYLKTQEKKEKNSK